MKIAGLKPLDVRGLLRDMANLDFENAADWPVPIKVASVALVFLVVLSLGYVLSIRGLHVDYRQQRQRQVSLLSRLEKQAAEARDPTVYRQQLATLEEKFKALARQLPRTAEMPALLEDISRIGRATGLEFRSIAPQEEDDRGFYAALPIHIEVVGGYHALGAFVSGVAALSRIVTLHDLVIEPARNEEGSEKLLAMTLTAKTWRYQGADAGDASQAASLPADIETLPRFHPVAAFAYQAQALRSPFIPAAERKPLAESPRRFFLADSNRPREYLERFALDSLTLVGTITRQGRPPEALVEDPTGLVTRVRPGSHLGQHRGRVVAVSPGRVALMETIADGQGQWLERRRHLSLQQQARQEKVQR